MTSKTNVPKIILQKMEVPSDDLTPTASHQKGPKKSSDIHMIFNMNINDCIKKKSEKTVKQYDNFSSAISVNIRILCWSY